VINTGVDDVTRRWTLRLVVGLAASALLLSGCSEQEANDTLPGADASPSESEPALPQLGPPEYPVPAAAREKTPGGALAFAEYYMSLGTEIAQGDISAKTLLDLSTEECRLCGQVAESFGEDQTAGYTYSPAYTFEEYGPAQISGDVAEIGFVYSQNAYTVTDSTGQEVPERAGRNTGNLQSGMFLVWSQDLQSWLVTSLTVG
jgi:hypothetical protein